MNIRDAQYDDFAAIAEITNHYIKSTPIHFGYEPVTEDDLRETWQLHPDHPYLVLTDDAGTLIGYAKAGVWRSRDAYAKTAEVGIYLHHSKCRAGGGTKLYTALVDRCREAGFHVLVGGMTMPNPASARLHEKCGFTHVGTFKQVGRKFDVWHDVAFYQRML